MSNFPLLIDVFEGSGLLDLPKLKENNIQYVIVRLGAYSRLGGLMGNRKDDLFDQQWSLLDTDQWFKKMIYIPYNPWISWQKNLAFLLENLPKNCYGVELDVENKRTLNYTSKTYGAEFSEYYKNIPSNIQKIIYTGEAFLPYLDVWPKGDYSWAQYPYSLRPSDTVYWNWDQFREKLSIYNGPFNQSKSPDVVKAWQVTGDKVVLPGSTKGMDVYAWLGTQEELDILFGVNNIIPPVDDPTDPEEPVDVKVKYKGKVNSNVFLGLQVRESAVTGKKIYTLKANESFEGDNIVTIQEKEWMHIFKPVDGWIAAWYTKYEKIDEAPPIIENPELKPAIPGAFYLQSDLDLGISWDERFKQAKLEAYPATINLVGGKGQVQLSPQWLNQVKLINTPKQYARLWTDEHGWHNKPHGEVGRVQQVAFAHSSVWVTGEDENYYYVDVYYNDEIPENLSIDYDKYRLNIFSIMSKNDARENGGIFYDDTGFIKTLMIANNKTEKLKIEKKYCKPLMFLPIDCKVKTDGSNLNIRRTPQVGEIVGNLKNNEKITVLEFVKLKNKIWGRIGENKWVAIWFTDLNI